MNLLVLLISIDYDQTILDSPRALQVAARQGKFERRHGKGGVDQVEDPAVAHIRRRYSLPPERHGFDIRDTYVSPNATAQCQWRYTAFAGGRLMPRKNDDGSQCSLTSPDCALPEEEGRWQVLHPPSPQLRI
jgi:hypothetical protein